MIFGDYFQLKGKHYLVIGDCLSGGVPEEISNHGGPEFVALETKNFFNRWGVKHKLSTSYLSYQGLGSGQVR